MPKTFSDLLARLRLKQRIVITSKLVAISVLHRVATYQTNRRTR
jgi:hypothetical protein